MTDVVPRAPFAVPVLALILALAFAAPDAAAQQQKQPERTGASAQPPRVLPAVRARPPASRQRPATQRPPAAQPQAARPATTTPARPAAAAPARTSAPGALASNGEKWEQISAQAVNLGATAFPVGRGHSGPSVMRVQVLLDRALFSPGMIDGRWGKNTQNALYWMQSREGLPATGAVDSATYARLEELAGRPAELVRAHLLTPDDVKGPFTAIPADIYEQARLSCSCYESLTEKLTESFHVSTGVLGKLNPGIRLDSLVAGDTLMVPNVRDDAAPAAGLIAQLLVSGTDNYLQALDSAGRILYHFPTTLGSTFDPSPQGDFRVTSVHPDPWWRYQPKLLAHVEDWKPEALIPPGPNSAVGKVWMALSAPHYGIHGTKSPETIGYATSAGCVRLTNWDVIYLSRRITPGVPVRFRETRTRAPAPADSVRPDSVRPAPAQRDSVRRDSVPRDSVRPAPVRRDSVVRDSARPTPAPTRTDSARPAPARRDPVVRDSTRPAPARTDSARPAPARSDTSRPAPARSDSATVRPAPPRPDTAAPRPSSPASTAAATPADTARPRP
jgi:lipoprotein-anchoring transpeptidase ErfK/SrfK